ncbi:S9 family peptidase [Amycolatopsis acidiphila]|uniref:S9 family peptidase n=1 Tax=Amycolatopsis acidiphila TaxID=715473 RepID=A0A558ADB8_9PSEU|nr:S9 family peptidase [Amycolatopsis acidiphila]TVT22259.1 S9 family peptidase [Amycolatopsis acidiphila]UIJ58030.1 S9 family peptidase [Amycolatopsis acidiphila]GHG70504.1 peptidase [Amycolatopsis acidiphila]
MLISAFGSWSTPVTAELVITAAVGISDVRADGAAVVWSERRPAEGGRCQLVRCGPDGTLTELLPDGFDARTSVHEYGGGDWWLRDGVIWFANWADQRLYRLESGVAEPLTPEPAVARGDRFADGDLSADGTFLVAVRERHSGSEVRNEVVRLAASGPGEPEVLVTGPDFVAAPRLSADDARLAWISWNHPSMPWDDTVLTVRELATGEETVVAGGPGESVSQPQWQPGGSLYFLSDRTGWWNLYRWSPGGGVEPVIVLDAEIGVPGWQLGTQRYVPLPDGRVVFARWSDGYDRLAIAAPGDAVTPLDLPFSAVAALRPAGGEVVLIAGTPTEEPGVYRVSADGAVRTIRAPRRTGLDPAYVSVPEAISFPSGDRTAHALFYPPANPEFAGPEGTRPPLIVMIHGGPTASAVPVLSLGVQFWTSRGFAVVDVNYGGSAGFGRAYREQLLGEWGVVDVADCLAAARWLAAQGRADGGKLLIRGGSAGGYTTLAALARPDTPFAAGTDMFGIADLEVLAADTHKFESRYLDRLIGPYPQAREVYVARSPIHRAAEFGRPLLVLQGADDPVVPPNQSELIVDALRSRQLPVAYLLFEGEQHGFRRAENIRRALEAELSFYSQILGFELPAGEGIEPVEVENLRSSR